MEAPRAVVIPFGVPDEGRGLGLGLAALVHACMNVQSTGVAIAQLHARRDDAHLDAAPAPVEAYVPPSAWRDIAERGDPPVGVGIVVTGSFEPPTDGHGTIRLLAFEAGDGRTRASIEASFDEDHAGAMLVDAFEKLGFDLGGEVGALRGLRDLAWEPLESVLRAERCALHDPARGGPHDRVAAMLHLGRAIGDAPDARYPTERLASMALDAAAASERDAGAALAALRALDRAIADAPSNLDLIEALAAVLLRLGRPQDAERRMNAVVAKAPRRARSYVLLAQALRAQSKFDAALAALRAAAESAQPDVMIGIERGVVLSAMRDFAGAAAAWNDVLSRHPLHPIAFARLTALAIRTRDSAAAQRLIDAALVAPEAPADVFRQAVQLALGTEAEGLARASRILRLCERWLARADGDPTATLVMARSLLVLGDREGARARVARLEGVVPRSPAAAELAALRLAIDEPTADLEIQGVLRAAHFAPVDRLVEISARARRLATLHSAWTAWLAAAVAERRRRRWAAARGALEVALEIAPGAAIVQIEMAEALMHLDDAAGAVSRARAALALDGPSAGALGLLARALARAGSTSEAIDAATAATAFDSQDAALAALLRQLKASKSRGGRARSGWLVRCLHAFARWLGRRSSQSTRIPLSASLRRVSLKLARLRSRRLPSKSR